MAMSAGGALRDRPEQVRPPRRDWPRALRALRRLLRDNDDTTQVFEIMRALTVKSARDGYVRLIRGPTGARLAFERVELAPRLMDAGWIAGFAPGTVGAAYHQFVSSENLSADGLVEVSRTGAGASALDAPDPVAWYARRVRDTHDLWHVLTGYGRDPLGEASLVAFSYSQTRGTGWLLIALGAFARGRMGIKGVRGAIVEGFRNGRKAAWLPGLDYERLMAMPLEAARAELGIRTPARYRRVVDRVIAAGGMGYRLPAASPNPPSRIEP